jgi:hypothetical protein
VPECGEGKGVLSVVTAHSSSNENPFSICPKSEQSCQANANNVCGNIVSWDTIRVPQRRGDEVLKFRGKRLIIKLDVEGHEDRVLNGLGPILTGNEVLLQVEIHPNQVERVLAIIVSLDFKLVHNIGVDFYFTNSWTRLFQLAAVSRSLQDILLQVRALSAKCRIAKVVRGRSFPKPEGFGL